MYPLRDSIPAGGGVASGSLSAAPDDAGEKRMTTRRVVLSDVLAALAMVVGWVAWGILLFLVAA